jgi:DNA helicase-2/ATP-dependent DNA helicase PcrA
MTRARDELHLIAPLKYYVTEQAPSGDRHVYGARSRFLTAAVLGCLDHSAWPVATAQAPGPTAQGARVDVGARLRELWD